MNKQLWLLLLVSFFHAALLAQQKLALVSNGKSGYSIVIPVDATAVEQEASKILQEYIVAITNCTLPVVTQSNISDAAQIFIGRNKFTSQKDIADLGTDGILIKTTGNSLVITGGPRKGVLYSVYTLLETFLSCRMYTSQVQYMPKQKNIVLPANIFKKEVPDFQFRMTYFEDAFKNNYCDFQKMNYWIEGWGLWVHSFEKLVPEKKYYAAHPEYFSLVHGKRTARQLCLTNPAVLNIVIENLTQLIKENPTALYWSISQNDNIDFCTCINCSAADAAAESHQGSLLGFINKVAAQFPDKIISTLAYQYSEPPPKNMRPSDNVLIMLCTANEQRSVPVSKQSATDFNTNFTEWSAICNNIFLWNYLVQYSNAVSPFPNLFTMQPDIQYFASKKVTAMFDQGIGDMPGEFSELRCYLVAHLMWNKDIDIKKVMDDFVKGYYGTTGAFYIQQYISLLHKNAAIKPVALRSAGSPAEAINSYLSPANIGTYKAIFKKALTATAGTVYQKRILKEFLPVLYAELEIKKAEIPDQKKAGSFNTIAYRKLLEDFYNKARQADIKYLNELRAGTADYYKNYILLLNDK